MPSLEVWQSGDSGYDTDNLYRNSNAYYFLPIEDEWLKAAYWNGSALQTYSTPDDTVPTAGVDSNYENVVVTWNVGSGSEELNGTFDMMGNVWEWMESPYISGDYLSGSYRGRRGGSRINNINNIRSSSRTGYEPYAESSGMGFRVASVPEPTTIALLTLGSVMLRKRKA